MTVAIYIRVSTEEQAAKGNSLQEQEERLRAYCKAMGWDECEAFIDDGYSAKDTNRPKLQEMLERIKRKEFKMIVTTKIDRLCRNLLDLLTIIDDLDTYQCGYISASESFDTSTPAGRMSLQILGAFAEFERQRIRERVRDNMQSIAKKATKAISRPCFGYDIIDGKFVINAKEADIVRQITEWMLRGEGAHKVMHRLNDLGIKTKDGNSFTGEAVRKLMQRETLSGMFVYNRKYSHKGKELVRPEEDWIVVENHHEPIIDKDTFEKLQLAMKARSTGHKQADNERWLLSGLVYCTHCGSKMVGRHRKKPSGREYFHYVCSSYLKKAECFHHFMDRDVVENNIIQVLLSVESSSIELGAIANMESETIKKETVDIKLLQNRLKKLNLKMQRQIELFEDGDISKEDFRIARDRIDRERNEVNAQLNAAEMDTSAVMIEKFVKRVEEFREDLISDDRGQLKNAIRSTINRINITDASDIDVDYRIDA